MGEDKEIQQICAYVNQYRTRHNISPTPGYKFEPSCIMFGEGYNLLYCQLVCTQENTGSWGELKDTEIRKLVLEEIARQERKANSKNNTESITFLNTSPLH